MAEILWALEATVIGCLLAYRFVDLSCFRPRWAVALLILGCGTPLGIGASSCIFIALHLLTGGIAAPILLESALTVWVLYDLHRRGVQPMAGNPRRPLPGTRLLACVLILLLALGILGMAPSWTANPHGNWDAWALWNLRARFLVSGTHVAERAWSPLLIASRPEYPLLLSAFVARCWAYSGSMTQSAPIATSLLFFLAMTAIGVGGLAVRQSSSLGLLFGIVLSGTSFLVAEVPGQCADIAVTCYFAGAVILLLLDRPTAAGLFAGFSLWTKEEGWLFLIVFLAAVAIFRRKAIRAAIAGAVPAMSLSLLFKLVLARGVSSWMTSETATGGRLWQRLFTLTRYTTVLNACINHMWNGIRYGLCHPLLPPIVIVLSLGFSPERRRDMLLAGSITVAMTAGYFLAYIATPLDLDWQLQTSLNRLFVQMWPCLVLTVFAGLRTPESTVIVREVLRKPGRQKKHA